MITLEDFKKTWTKIDQKLDRNWKLNLEIIRRSNIDKSKSKMKNLVWIKAISLAFCLFFTILFIVFSVSNWGTIHLATAGITLATWTLSICVASIHELGLITQIDYSSSIPELQKRLSRVRLAIIKYIRLGVWIAPLYFAFIILFFKIAWNLDIVAVGDQKWILSNIILSIAFIPAAIWAHRKLSPKNAEAKWMNNLLQGNGSQITSALALIKEVEEFESSSEPKL